MNDDIFARPYVQALLVRIREHDARQPASVARRVTDERSRALAQALADARAELGPEAKWRELAEHLDAQGHRTPRGAELNAANLAAWWRYWSRRTR